MTDMGNITDKWQCVKCKITKIKLVRTILLDNQKLTIHPEDVPEVMCHNHMMRNLSEDNYISENTINSSGARDDNFYRKLSK